MILSLNNYEINGDFTMLQHTDGVSIVHEIYHLNYEIHHPTLVWSYSFITCQVQTLQRTVVLFFADEWKVTQ